MESLNTKVSQINQKFKNNALTSSIVNIVLLALVFLFFSIGFDLTKKLLLDFVDLSWASIFPSLIDLATVAGLIFTLKYFSNILTRPDFLLHLDSKEIEEILPNENNPKIVEFLNSAIYGKLMVCIWYPIILFVFNYLFNLALEGANDKLSPLNEWYLLSASFTHLPIFPINLMCIFVLIAIVLPTNLNYAKYKLEIAEASNIQRTKTINKEMIKNQVSEVKNYRWGIFTALSVICIILSLMKRENAWLFQYNTPISDQNVLAEKLSEKSSAFCEKNLSFNIFHERDVLTVTEHQTNQFSGDTNTTDHNYAITPELKQSLVLMCEKKAEEDRKLMIDRKKKEEQYLKKLMEDIKKKE